MPPLNQLRVVDPVLTNVALGYTNAEFIADALFPILPNQKRGGKIVKFGKEAFKLYTTLRAMRAKSKRIDWDNIPMITLALEDHTLEGPIDDEELTEQSNPIDLQIRTLNTVTEAIQLEREKTAADLAQDLANYPAGNKVTLAGAAQWNDAASTPISDINTGREAVRSKIGRYPNTLMIGPIVFNRLGEHASIIDKIKYTQRGIVTADLLAALFSVDRVVVGKAVWSDQAGVFTDIWGKHAILAWVPPGVGKEIPSFGYTPRLVGKPQVFRYREEPKLEIIYAEDVYQVLITTSEAGYFVQNAVA